MSYGAAEVAMRGLSDAKLANVHLNFGRGFMSIDAPSEALEELNAALALRPKLVGALHTKGHALAILGRQEEAIRVMGEALRWSYGDPEIASQKRQLEEQLTLQKAKRKTKATKPKPSPRSGIAFRGIHLLCSL